MSRSIRSLSIVLATLFLAIIVSAPAEARVWNQTTADCTNQLLAQKNLTHEEATRFSAKWPPGVRAAGTFWGYCKARLTEFEAEGISGNAAVARVLAETADIPAPTLVPHRPPVDTAQLKEPPLQVNADASPSGTWLSATPGAQSATTGRASDVPTTAPDSVEPAERLSTAPAAPDIVGVSYPIIGDRGGLVPVALLALLAGFIVLATRWSTGSMERVRPVPVTILEHPEYGYLT